MWEPKRFSPGADEIIRQVTIISAERGLLLLRVRDEIRMSAECDFFSARAGGERRGLGRTRGYHRKDRSETRRQVSPDRHNLSAQR